MSFVKPEEIQNTPGGDAVNQGVMKTDANIDDIYTNLNSLDASKAAASHLHSDATPSADGFMSHEDKTKLDGIEEGSRVGMSGAEIKVEYEAEPNTNAYTDTDKSKLLGIESGATADQTASQIKSSYESNPNTNAYTDVDKAKVGHVTVTQAVNLDTLESDTANNNAKVTNATHSGDVSGATTLTIGDDKVTYAKMQNIPTANILGRVSASTGNVEDLTATQARTLLNIEDGATADLTASQILALLLTVDSNSSGLNATTLQGHAPSYFAEAGGDYTKKFQCAAAASGSDAVNLTFANAEYLAKTDATVAPSGSSVVLRDGYGDVRVDKRIYFDDGVKYLLYDDSSKKLWLYNGVSTLEIATV